MTRFGRKKTMVILLTAIILSGVANRFAPNYPAFLIGLHFNVRYLKLLLPGVFLCAFMSLAYGTVMYVWMMEHCDGEFLLQLNPTLNISKPTQVRSRLFLEPALTTTLAFGV